MQAATVRRPSVAGYFYPAGRGELTAALDHLAPAHANGQQAMGLVLPHGSLRQAGKVLLSSVASIAVPDRCVLVGPSHVQTHQRWSLLRNGSYDTPLGEAPIDEVLAQSLLEQCPFLEEDRYGQAGEHSAEVPLVALQHRRRQTVSIVPVIASQDDREEARSLGKALAVAHASRPFLLVASVDCAQFVTQEAARRQAQAVASALERLDPDELAAVWNAEKIQPCGAAALECLIAFAQTKGATRTRLLAIGTSADEGGDPCSATGYAGVAIH